MNILSNKTYNELLENKKELEAIQKYFTIKRREAGDCKNFYSKEVEKYDLSLASTASVIFSLIERYFEKPTVIESDITKEK